MCDRGNFKLEYTSNQFNSKRPSAYDKTLLYLEATYPE